MTSLATAGSDAASIASAIDEIRSALATIADHGVGDAYLAPASILGDDTVAAVAGHAAAVLTSVTTLLDRELPPRPTEDPGARASWVDALDEYVQAIAGPAVRLAATYRLPAGRNIGVLTTAQGASSTAIMTWLRRLARVRQPIQALHDVILVGEAVLDARPIFTAMQLPVVDAPVWAGLPFGDAEHPARLATVAWTPGNTDVSAPLCGFVFDTWTELVPGLSIAGPGSPREAAEITGLAFTVDAPDAQAPHAILLAVPPDPGQPWSLDVLFDVVSETLELAKMRTVDLGDLPRLGRVLPATPTGHETDQMLFRAGAT